MFVEFVLCIGVSNSLVPMSLGTILFALFLGTFGDALYARLIQKEGGVTMCLLESS